MKLCDDQKQTQIYFDLYGNEISPMTAACVLRFLPNGQNRQNLFYVNSILCTIEIMNSC